MSGGGSLGLGKQKTDSSSESWQTGDSLGVSTGISGDTSRAGSVSEAGGSSFTRQNIAFEDLFDQLYRGASGATRDAVANADVLGATAQQLFTGGSSFLENLGGDAGSDYMASRLSGENPVLDEQIALLREDTSRLFSEELNPAITSRAVAGGTFGGGRQGVAQGMAMEAAADQFTRGAAALRSSDIAQRDAIASTIATNSLTAANTGLGALPMLLDLATEGSMAELNAYGGLAQILGGPTVLTEGGSTDFSRGSSYNISDAFSRSFGQQTSTTRGGSTSTSRGRGWNFDMSGYGGVMASGGG